LGPPLPPRHRLTLALPQPDPQLGRGRGMALSQRRLGVLRRCHSQQTPNAKNQTHRRAWYLVEEVRHWEKKGRKPWKTKDGLRPIGMITRLMEKKGLHLLGALDLPATLEAGRPLMLLLPLLCLLLLLLLLL
jgi:hypothetical protein